LNYVVLKYFNAAGAHASGESGEKNGPETYFIPIILQYLLGLREQVSVFGYDYDTAEGTSIRDYTPVTDLAEAHLKALKSLLDGKKAQPIILERVMDIQ
jgi:UDP-glucose 4-epimerase